MFKRISILLDKPLREKLEKDRGFGASPLVQNALQAFSDLQRVAIAGCWPSDLPNFESAVDFSTIIGRGSRWEDLKRGFSQATRIAVFIRLVCDGVIDTEIEFHHKNEKKCWMSISIRTQDGQAPYYVSGGYENWVADSSCRKV